MKILTIQPIVLISIVTGIWGLDTEYYDLNKAPEIFSMFMLDYNKIYADVTDLLMHYEVFKNNLESINEYNSLNKGFSKIYMGEYADMTPGELQAIQDDQTSEYEDNYRAGNSF